MQLMGLSQLEAKSYLDIVSQLEEMERQGDLDSRARQEAEDRLKALSMTEKDWRAKTLTLQEKMARFLELIWTVVGRVFIGFIRGAAGAAAGPETSNFLAAISRGEGIDVPLEQWSKGITALGREVTPAAERLGGVFGDVFRKLTDWLTGANEHTRSVENRTAAENKATLATLKAADALRQMAGAAGPREKGPAEMLARYIELQDLIERQTTAQQEAFQSLKNIQERQRAAVTPAGSGGIPYTGFTEQAQEEATNRLRETNNALDALKQEMTGLRDQLQEGLPRLPQGDIRSQVEATLGRAQQGGDIWDIMKAGFLYASPGDMVIDAESLGAAAGQGVAGTGISGMLSRLQTQTRGAAATRGGRTSTEHELIFHIKGVDERMNILIDERIAYNIEQDKIVPGKLGASALRHGSSYRGYS